jgi:hypothetical protein
MVSFLWQIPAHARYRCETIGPTNTATAELAFHVSVEDQGTLAFTVTISPSIASVSPTNLHPILVVHDSEGVLAQCPVRSELGTNGVTCRFSLTRRALPHSSLSVSTGHFIQGSDTEGRPSGGRIAVGTIYSVNLSEFVKEDAPNNRGQRKFDPGRAEE